MINQVMWSQFVILFDYLGWDVVMIEQIKNSIYLTGLRKD